MANEDDISAAVRTVQTWTRGDERAPHKPLLLLLALARVQRGEPRLGPFTEFEAPLRRLLVEFGPSRGSYHPEYPFWRLQNDGLWEVPERDQLRPRASNTDVPITQLRKASGGFPHRVQEALQANPDLVRKLGHEILDAHFPPSLHESILAAVGLDLEPPVAKGERRARDRTFRELVLRAYGYRCAVCGLDSRLDGNTIGLEAAHIKWHSHGGPDNVENGLCLCPLHHTALDLGLIGVASDFVIVSSRLDGGEAVEAQLGRFHGATLVHPAHNRPHVAPPFTAWHTEWVFKKPARGQ